MAGGKGTRLRPLTCDIPKPMVPILNKPVMEYSINLLKNYNITDIAVTMAYLPNVITDYFGNGENFGVNLQYFIEDTPLGTGGSVKNAEEFLGDTFLVISGDALTDLDIEKAIQFHKSKKSQVTIVLKKENVPLEYGVVITDEEGRIIRFLEKPNWGEVFSDTVNTGIYILEPSVLRHFKKGENFDFSKDLFPKLLEEKAPMYGYIMDEYWNDIGDLNSYMETQFHILDKKVNFNIQAKEIQDGVWIEDGVILGQNIKFVAPVYIGKDSIIKDNASLHGYSIIGRNCEIGEETTLKKSILWKNTKVGKNSHCRGSVICNNVQMQNGISAFESSAVGSGSMLSNGVLIKPNSKIWPDKKIEENSIVNDNLIWGTKATKTIFGYKGISGNLNVDITPEFASKIATSFASIMNNEDSIAISCDCSNSTNVIKQSMISGILSAGLGVIDIKESPITLNRYAVRHFSCGGGIHVRASHYDLNKINLQFIGSGGANIDKALERKIENIFNTEDFVRCSGDRMKNIMTIDNFATQYIKSGSQIIENKEKIKYKSTKILVASNCNSLTQMCTQYLKNIGCSVTPDYSSLNFAQKNECLEYLKSLVIGKNMDFAVFINEDGESMTLIDDKGNLIEGENYLALSMLILLKMGNVKKVVLPHTSTRIVDKMAKMYSVEVVRCKSSQSDYMKELEKVDNMLMQYILCFDAILACGIIVDYLVKEDRKLSDLVSEIPEFYYKVSQVPCDFTDKGRIIKNIIMDHQSENVELFEGVKFNTDKGWALILPDSEKARFNIYAEGYSQEYADELSIVFGDKIKKLMKK